MEPIRETVASVRLRLLSRGDFAHSVWHRMRRVHHWRWAGVLLALTLGLTGCVIPRNPFPMKAAHGPSAPVALLPLNEADVGGYGTVPTNQMVRVTNRVLNSIASSKNNLIGPADLATEGGAVTGRRAIKTRVYHLPDPADVSIVSWSLSVETEPAVRVEMELLEGERVIAQADATEVHHGYTQCLLVFPVFYAGETLGNATDRAARRALTTLLSAEYEMHSAK